MAAGNPIVPDVSVGLSLFGSLVTEMSPPDLPEGVSPDNQDIAYYPGGVQGRPCLNKRALAFTPGSTITHCKTYLQPNDTKLNIYLDSAGVLWSEDVHNNPGVLVQIGIVTPGSYANSLTAFGRHYLSFHDGKNPTDVPLQFDGVYLDRVTQDAVGAPPQVSDAPQNQLSIIYINAASQLNIVSATESGLVITIVCSAPHGMYTGDAALVNTGNSTYDNSDQPILIENVPTPSSFSYTVGITQLPNYTSGTVTPLIATLQTNGPHGLLTDDGFILSGTGTSYDNNFNQVLAGPAINISQISQLPTGTYVVTVVTTAAHGLQVGDNIIVGTGNVYYDGPGAGTLFPIDSVPNPITLTYTVGYNDLPTLSSGTITKQTQINSPANWTVRTIIDSQTLTFSVITGGGANFTFQDIHIGPTNPAQWRTIESDGSLNEEWQIADSIWRTIDSWGNPARLLQPIYTQDLGFTLSNSLIITGIQFNLQWQNQSGGATGTLVSASLSYLGAQLGTAKVLNISSNGFITDTLVGGESDMWGAALTPAIVNDPTFGIEFQILQGAYNGTSHRLFIDGVDVSIYYNNAAVSGSFFGGGLSSLGPHQCSCFFLTRQGAITGASPPVSFTSAGFRKYQINQLPIGPPNVVGRILTFTGAYGSRSFQIPAIPQGQDITGKTVPIGTATVINDNTTTSIVLDVADNTLFSATGMDIVGNDYFETEVLHPCLGQFYYASRMAWYGFLNSIDNLLNMGFEGGVFPNTPYFPCGWSYTSLINGGSVVASPTGRGLCWAINGDGSSNERGNIYQGAYQDYYGIAILQPNTQYTLKFWAEGPGTGPGDLYFTFQSTTLGILATVTVPIASLPVGGGFVSYDFSAKTPAVIPPDMIFNLYETNMAAGVTIAIDELQIVPTQDSIGLQFLISYVNNPEAFDAVTGLLGSTDDATPIQCCFLHKELMHFLTCTGLHSTRDVGSSEPSGWPVNEVSNRCGAASPRAVDVGENFAVWVSAPTSEPPVPIGIYVYYGGDCIKVSQENQPFFDGINPSAIPCIWVKNDINTRRILVGLPIATLPSGPPWGPPPQ